MGEGSDGGGDRGLLLCAVWSVLVVMITIKARVGVMSYDSNWLGVDVT